MEQKNKKNKIKKWGSMDPVHGGGPWTRSMKGVHGPGPKRGSMDQGPCFVLSRFAMLIRAESGHIVHA